MNLFFFANLDADTAGALPAWMSGVVGTWQVRNDPSNAVSSPNTLETNPAADGDKVLILGGSGVSIPAVADMTFAYDTLTPGSGPCPMVRASSDGQNGYLWVIVPGSPNTAAQLYKCVGGALTTVGGQTSVALSTGGNPILHAKASATGSTIGLKLWTGSNTEPGSPQWIQTDSSITAAGYAGFYNVGTSAGFAIDNLTLYGNSSLASGTLSSSNVLVTSLTVTATAASGGTSSYTYQWYRSTTSGFVPQTANLISGATSLTLSDSGLTGSTAYYYRLVSTDSAGAIVWSSEFSVTTVTSSALASGTASLSSVGTTVATVTVANPTGGTSPYTYKWYRSTTSGFTPGAGNIVSGATAQTLNDTGLSASTNYYYKNVVTDHVAATAVSNQVIATTGAAFGAGSAASTYVGATAAQLSATNASGGSGSYTYQWYRSTMSGSNGSAISGATSESLVDTTAAANTDYYYSLQYIDTAGGPPVFSAQVHIKTLAVAAEEVVGGIGDSIMMGAYSAVETPFNAMIDQLNYMLVTKQFTGVNRAISGTTSVDWSSTSTGSDLANAVAAFVSAGVTRVVLMLSTNDSKASIATSPSAYATNVAAIIAYLKANVSTLKTIHLFSSPFQSLTSGDLSVQNSGRLIAYASQLSSLADGTSVFYSQPLTSYNLFQNNPALLRDGIHPTDIGDQTMGALWASNVASDLTVGSGEEALAGYNRSRIVNA